MSIENSIEILLQSWKGPMGGLPPFDQVDPAAIAPAYERAIALRRGELRRVAEHPEPPNFENTIAAIDDSGLELRQIDTIYRVWRKTLDTGEHRDAFRHVAALASGLDAWMAGQEDLVARVQAVYETRHESMADEEQTHLTECLYQKLRRCGAGLPRDARARVAEINARLAELRVLFDQNLLAEQDEQHLCIARAEQLQGVSEELPTGSYALFCCLTASI